MTSKKPDPQSELAKLIAERERKDSRLEEITLEREQIAHAALTGNAGARERLAELKCEAAALTDHGKDVEAAIAQAERNVAAAGAAARRKEEIAAAERRKAYAAELRLVGQEADQGKLERLAAIPDGAAAAGVEFLTLLFVRPKVMDVLHATTLRPLHTFMRPLERREVPRTCERSFAELLGKWADRIDQEARAIVGEQTSKEAA